MRVGDLLTAPVTTVQPHDSLGHAAKLLQEGGFRHLPVVLDDRLVGMISDREIAEARARGAIQALLTVESFMWQDVVTATPDMSVQQASRLFLDHKIGALPVVEDGRVVGIVTTSDLCRALAQEGERLPSRIGGSPAP